VLHLFNLNEAANILFPSLEVPYIDPQCCKRW